MQIWTVLSIALTLDGCGGYDVKLQSEVYTPDYKVYHNVSQVVSRLEEFKKEHFNYITLNKNFKSKNGLPQLLIKMSNFSLEESEKSKQVKILFAFGEHAREFFPVESLLYFLKNITNGLSKRLDTYDYKFSEWVLNNFHIEIISLANPDGRVLIEKTKNYCWRGTSSGVDINRNFDWNYGDKGSSTDPADGEYRGPHAFSGLFLPTQFESFLCIYNVIY